MKASFRNAKPVWLKGKTLEMNILGGFRMAITRRSERSILRITASTIYKVWLDGIFIGHGPARCGHGYFRIDEWCLPAVSKDSVLAIEVCGYNVNSYAYLDHSSFVQAEVVDGEKVLAASGTSSFCGYHLKERVQKVHRYSYQRPFSEAYRLSQSFDVWKKQLNPRQKKAPLEICEKPKLVSRGIPYPEWPTRQALKLTASGSVKASKDPKKRWPREWRNDWDYFKMFRPEEGTEYPAHTVECMSYNVSKRPDQLLDESSKLQVSKGKFSIVDFGTNLTGFIGMSVECKEEVDLYLCFDEMDLPDGDVSTLRNASANVIHYRLKAGKYTLESLEPYTLKFLKMLSLKGRLTASRIFIREYSNSDAHRAQFSSSDTRLNDLFIAAKETFAQNATDVYMDCPGRERAGWLCDSFFTARAELTLCGHSQVERNFLENYLLPKKFPHLPKGMLPMCYPSDHTDGWFIPNWAMWFVIQLKEYSERTGDRSLIASLKKRVYDLVDYFKPFLNEDGLLESLEKWVFLEWSKANDFTQDVSYASNMVYVGMLEAAADLYGDSELLQQASKTKRVILKQSYDGEFFVDNALRKENGTLEVTRNRTETCQYYAFFFDLATPKSHPKLWKRLENDFGPRRNPAKLFPDIHPSNAFIGFFLRLNILSRYGRPDLVLDQLYRDFVPMSEKTGTLWEHKDTGASCNHGFASQVSHILVRDILGIHIDPVGKKVEWKVPDIDLNWCSAKVPIGNDWVVASWKRVGKKIEKKISVPEGYGLNV